MVHPVRDLQHEVTEQISLVFTELCVILLEKFIRGHLGVAVGLIEPVPLFPGHIARLDTEPVPRNEAAREAAVPVHGPPAGRRVPGVVTARPGEAGGEGGEEVEEGPGDENVVVDTDIEG